MISASVVTTPRLTALARCAATVPAWRWGPAGYGRSSGADYLYNTYLIGQEKAGVAFEGSSMRKNTEITEFGWAGGSRQRELRD